MTGFLTQAVARIRHDLDRRPLPEDLLRKRAMAAAPPLDLAAALRRGGPALIAEVKRASPSAGTIATVRPQAQAIAYARAGAVAISVLTEPRWFDGSLSDLRLVRKGVRLPILRKDFVVHPSQVMESRAEGADAVLLIAAALSGSELSVLIETTRELGLTPVVEAHGEEDLTRAIDSGAEVVAVNARDLETLTVDLDGALELARRVPPDRIVVVESGIARREDVERAARAGAHAVLVGEALMRADDPEAKVRELLGAGGP